MIQIQPAQMNLISSLHATENSENVAKNTNNTKWISHKPHYNITLCDELNGWHPCIAINLTLSTAAKITTDRCINHTHERDQN